MSYFVISSLYIKCLGKMYGSSLNFFYRMVDFIMVFTAEAVTCFRDLKMSKNKSVVANICSFSNKVLPCAFFHLVFYAVTENTYSPCNLCYILRSTKMQLYCFHFQKKMRCFWDKESCIFCFVCGQKDVRPFHLITFWGKVDWAQGGKIWGRE